MSTVNELVPEICVPAAAVNVYVALARSRGVDVATSSTSKPVAVTFVICTLFDSMIGAVEAMVMVEAGVCVPTVRLTARAPATVPGSSEGSAKLVTPAGMTKVAVEDLLPLLPIMPASPRYPEGSPLSSGAKETVSEPLKAAELAWLS